MNPEREKWEKSEIFNSNTMYQPWFDDKLFYRVVFTVCASSTTSHLCLRHEQLSHKISSIHIGVRWMKFWNMGSPEWNIKSWPVRWVNPNPTYFFTGQEANPTFSARVRFDMSNQMRVGLGSGSNLTIGKNSAFILPKSSLHLEITAPPPTQISDRIKVSDNNLSMPRTFSPRKSTHYFFKHNIIYVEHFSTLTPN